MTSDENSQLTIKDMCRVIEDRKELQNQIKMENGKILDFFSTFCGHRKKRYEFLQFSEIFTTEINALKQMVNIECNYNVQLKEHLAQLQELDDLQQQQFLT